MYNFIFAFHYFFFKKFKNTTHRSMAASFVAITFFIHFFMFWNSILYFTGINILPIKPFDQDYLTNKLYLLPIAFFYDYLFVLFYTHKRAMAIVNKYPQDYEVITLKNVVLVLLIMILPLLIGIQFLLHSH
jgi:hypothetical protein